MLLHMSEIPKAIVKMHSLAQENGGAMCNKRMCTHFYTHVGITSDNFFKKYNWDAAKSIVASTLKQKTAYQIFV